MSVLRTSIQLGHIRIKAMVRRAMEAVGVLPPIPARNSPRKSAYLIDAVSERFWRETKNAFAGRRGFVIGNGPSLRVEDLHRLTGQVCIASNKIFLAFDQTAWRPSYFTIVDDLVWEGAKKELHRYVPQVLIPSFFKAGSTNGLQVITFRSLRDASDVPFDTSVMPFSSDGSIGFHGGQTVTYINIQLAVHLGLDPIYLIGCDHFYDGTLGQGSGGPVDPGQTENHFMAGYTKPGQLMNPAQVSRMTLSYKWAQRYAEEHGIRIINATRGGHLEVFARADLDELLDN
jgi:hypothetical protein